MKEDKKKAQKMYLADLEQRGGTLPMALQQSSSSDEDESDGPYLDDEEMNRSSNSGTGTPGRKKGKKSKLKD